MIGDVQHTDLVTPAVDEDRLSALEQDLADAAAALEAIERIMASDLAPIDRVSAIEALAAGARFDVDEPAPATQGTLPGTIDDGPGAAASDLVGDGDLAALEQLDSLPEDEASGT